MLEFVDSVDMIMWPLIVFGPILIGIVLFGISYHLDNKIGHAMLMLAYVVPLTGIILGSVKCGIMAYDIHSMRARLAVIEEQYSYENEKVYNIDD